MALESHWSEINFLCELKARETFLENRHDKDFRGKIKLPDNYGGHESSECEKPLKVTAMQ